MLIAFDIGNSSVSIGVFEESSNTPTATLKILNKPYSADEYVYCIEAILQKKYPELMERGKFDHAVVSSVVPEITDRVARAAECICGKKPFIITSGIKTGFGIKLKNNEQLGADIVCNSAAAVSLMQDTGAAAVLDMGTATTLTVIDESKNVIGVVITPGVSVSLNALTNSAALLQNVRLENENILLGRNTDEAINSGIINGMRIMLDGFIREIREQYGQNGLSLIATGGQAKIIIPHMKNKFKYRENLTLEGEALLFRRNHPAKDNFV